MTSRRLQTDSEGQRDGTGRDDGSVRHLPRPVRAVHHPRGTAQRRVSGQSCPSSVNIPFTTLPSPHCSARAGGVGSAKSVNTADHSSIVTLCCIIFSTIYYFFIIAISHIKLTYRKNSVNRTTNTETPPARSALWDEVIRRIINC